jgi:hypothetical protein
MYQAPPPIKGALTPRRILGRFLGGSLLVLPLTWAAMFGISRALWQMAEPWHTNEGISSMLLFCAAPFFIGAGTVVVIALVQAGQPIARPHRRLLGGCGMTLFLYLPVTLSMIVLVDRLHPVSSLQGNDFSPAYLRNNFIAVFISSALITAISSLLAVFYQRRYPHS